MPVPIILDCDPGIDDAVALLLALASPDEIDLLAVTAVAGNVPLELTQANARRVCDLARRPDVKVFAGADRPYGKSLVTAEHVHGTDGLGNIGLPPPVMPLQDGDAVDAMIDILKASEPPVTLCPVGPLTNVAAALDRAPEIAGRIDRIVLMGGAMMGGNVTPHAEFNIHVDPVAADIVFRCGRPVVMFGLDVTHKVRVTADRHAAIRALGTPVATAVADMIGAGGGDVDDIVLHDPCVIAYLLAPDLFQGAPRHVSVVTGPSAEEGRTVAAPPSDAQQANATVMTDADADGFFALLTVRLARF